MRRKEDEEEESGGAKRKGEENNRKGCRGKNRGEWEIKLKEGNMDQKRRRQVHRRESI